MRKTIILAAFLLSGVALVGGGSVAQAEIKINPFPLKEAMQTEPAVAPSSFPSAPEAPQSSAPAQRPLVVRMEEPDEADLSPVDLSAGTQVAPEQVSRKKAFMGIRAARVPNVVRKQARKPVDITQRPSVDMLPMPGEYAAQQPDDSMSSITPASGGPSNVLDSVDKYNLVAIGAVPVNRGPAAQARTKKVVTPRVWEAVRGADLHETLRLWSDQARAEVLWGAGQGFSVPGTFKFTGTFENAVAALLEGFSGDGRPVANLYIDPQSGQRSLVIHDAG